MTDRTTEYILVPSRRKAKKPKQYYYNEDEDNDDNNNNDDDDNDSQIYGRLVPIKPRKEQRIKYISNDEIFSDYRKHRSEVCVCVCGFNLTIEHYIIVYYLA